MRFEQTIPGIADIETPSVGPPIEIPAMRDDRLAQLAADIRAANLDMVESSRRGLEHARRCGGLLAEAKATVSHGEWRKWLKDNTGVSYRSAARYMQIARHWDDLKAKVPSVADLTLAGAAELLGTENDPSPKKTPKREPYFSDPQPERVDPGLPVQPIHDPQKKEIIPERPIYPPTYVPIRDTVAGDTIAAKVEAIASELEILLADVSQDERDEVFAALKTITDVVAAFTTE